MIFNPAMDELYTAERGGGAFLNDRRLRVSGRPSVDPIAKQSFQLLPRVIGIGVTGEQPFKCVLLDRLALQGSERLEALMLLGGHVDG